MSLLPNDTPSPKKQLLTFSQESFDPSVSTVLFSPAGTLSEGAAVWVNMNIWATFQPMGFSHLCLKYWSFSFFSRSLWCYRKALYGKCPQFLQFTLREMVPLVVLIGTMGDECQSWDHLEYSKRSWNHKRMSLEMELTSLHLSPQAMNRHYFFSSNDNKHHSHTRQLLGTVETDILPLLALPL